MYSKKIGIFSRLPLATGLLGIWVSLYIWMFHFYPVMGHEFSGLEPDLNTLQISWHQFSAWDIDFSPLRCLGLPVFANQGTFGMSLIHLIGLFFPILTTFYLAVGLILTFGYLGCVRLARRSGLTPNWAAFVAVAWCLQGWCFIHLTVGHFNYSQLVLLPWIFHVMADSRSRTYEKAAVAFWWAHLFYTSGIYIILFGVPSLFLAFGVRRWMLARHGNTVATVDPVVNTSLLGFMTNTVGWLALGTAAASAKILATLNLMGKFPRVASLDQVGLWRATIYSASNFFYPVPYDIKAMAGWIYGNWESYQFLAPGAAIVASLLVLRFRKEVPAPRFFAIFIGIIGLGALVTSGVLAPVLSALPVFRSLRANPRWFCITLLPYLILLLSVFTAFMTRLEQLSVRTRSLLWIAGFAIFVAVPPCFLDRANLWIYYNHGTGYDTETGMVSFCQDAIYGDYMELFPKKPVAGIDWLHTPLLDPRCYLNSYHCDGFPELAPSSEAMEQLRTFRLRDETPSVRYAKWFSFPLYFLLFFAAVGVFGKLAWEEFTASDAGFRPS
jgi:hypothetical protein